MMNGIRPADYFLFWGRRRDSLGALHLRGNRDGSNDTSVCSRLLVFAPRVLIPVYQNKKRPADYFYFGGEEGIRTLDTVARIHDFESRAFDHSATSPRVTLYRL